MKNINLGILASPITWTYLWSYNAALTQGKKKFVHDQSIYQDLKKQVVEVYKQQIDETQEQPLIHLLDTKKSKLDPELKKRLQLLKDWRKQSVGSEYKYAAVICPLYFSCLIFPKLTAFTMTAFAFCCNFNYINDRQILSGGKQKSYLSKTVMPKQSQILNAFEYISYGILIMTMLKLGLLKLNMKATQKMLKDWRSSHRK